MYLPSDRRLLFLAAGQDSTDWIVAAATVNLKNNIVERINKKFLNLEEGL